MEDFLIRAFLFGLVMSAGVFTASVDKAGKATPVTGVAIGIYLVGSFKVVEIIIAGAPEIFNLALPIVMFSPVMGRIINFCCDKQ